MLRQVAPSLLGPQTRAEVWWGGRAPALPRGGGGTPDKAAHAHGGKWEEGRKVSGCDRKGGLSLLFCGEKPALAC